jgi:hypothetical protein
VDILETAVVDVSWLLATARALGRSGSDGPRGLRPELRRAVAAYLRALAKAKLDAPADAVLGACRVAAESEMTKSLQRVDELRAMMTARPGALEGFAQVRHDLWRLARIAAQSRRSAAHLRGIDAVAIVDVKRLGKRLRKALGAYARASMRGDHATMVGRARRAACGALGTKVSGNAKRLSLLACQTEEATGFVDETLLRSLSDLLLDWQAAAKTL